MRISRRQFGAAVAAGLSAAGTTILAADEKQEQLRVIAYNIFKCTG